jgi:hypothetical protein
VAYERAFARWSQPCEEFDVDTATATTRVHAYRPHSARTPAVLLSGAGFNASTVPRNGAGEISRFKAHGRRAAIPARAAATTHATGKAAIS